MGGTAITSHSSLILSPGVNPRIGALWKLKPIETNKFEVSMEIKVTKPPDSVPIDEVFAVWFVHENVTQEMATVFQEHIQNQDHIVAGTWGNIMTEKKYNMAGYKTNYKGLGLFFKVSSEGNSVSAVLNDGTTDMAAIPAADAYKFDFTNGAATTVKLDHGFGYVKVEILHGGVSQGTRTISTSLENAYVGMSSGSIPKDGEAKDARVKTTKIELVKLDIVNKDETKKIEDVHAVPQTEKRDLEKVAESEGDVLHESSSKKDHRGESDAIKELTNMVFKLVTETQPMRQQMSRAIDSLGSRITIMEKNFAELQAEIDKKSGHKMNEEFAAIKDELSSLSTLTSKNSHERQKRLERVHGDIADVHRAAHSADGIDKHLDKLLDSNNQVIDKLNDEHHMMFGVSIAALAFIIVAGLSLYNKFRCWEKKHSL